MRKLFTLFAVALASFSLWAQDLSFTFTNSTLPSGWTCSDKGSTEFSDGTGALKVKVNATLTYTFEEAVDLGSIDFVFAFNSKDAGLAADISLLNASDEEVGTAQLVQAEKQSGSKVKQEQNVELNAAGVKKFTLTNSSEKELLIGGITFNTGASSDPSLKASVNAVDLFVTPLVANPSAKVTFTGKNLTNGTYNLALSSVAGLTVTPAQVTVSDGALNAEVTLAYTSAVDVEQAAAELSLTIDALVAKVDINYAALSKYCGELIRATHTGGKKATVTGIIGGTVDKNTQDNGKLGSNGHYFGIKLAEGNFQDGDVVTIHATTVSTIVQIFSDKGETMLNEGTFDANGIYTYELEAETEWIYLYRTSTADKNMNPVVDYIAVTRDCSEEPKLSVSPASIKLKATADATSTSATVHFSGRNLAAGTYNLSLTSVAGLSADKSQVTVAADGKLSEDVVITYSSTVDVEAGQAELSLTIGEKNAKVAIDYVAKISKQYANSINIEQFVLDNGVKADIRAALDAANIEYENIDDLDSLAASKDYNNYPFLGLKLKKEDAQLGFWLKQGSYVNLKFGNIGAGFTVFFGDGEMPVDTAFANKQPNDSNVVSCEPVAEDTYVTIVCGSTKTLVIKQIMIDEDIQPVDVSGGVDPTKDSDATIKSLSINGEAITRDGFTFAYEVPADVDLAAVEVVYVLNSDKATGNPESGFMVDVPAAGAPANEQTLIVTAESGAEMEYVISVTRAAAQGLFDLNAAAPATKLLRNGQLLILRGDKTFTVMGQEL